jgi:UPF0755 protein
MTQKFQFISTGLLLGMCAVLFLFNLGAPKDFPSGARFQVREGESLYSISSRLKNDHIIGSALLFRGWISAIGKDKDIGLGVYAFDAPLSLGMVIAKVVAGPDEPLVSVTIPEGYTTQEIAAAFQKALPAFSPDIFGEIVREKRLDGYLFPSTYYPLPSSSEDDIVKLLNSTFEREYGKHFSDFQFPAQVTTRQEVVSLASIIEGEAKTEKDMRIVSGILQKRLEKGMRLQVDVAEATYKEGGIPEMPISNPGLVAIDAVFHPQASEYLYYLTGKDGRMYYAKTFDEHKRNIERYLR